jgi:hypothetical protein
MPGTGWLDERRLRNPSLKLSDDSPAALLGLAADYNPASAIEASDEMRSPTQKAEFLQ